MMTNQQQGDVLLYQTVNDGDIIVNGGLVQMTGGLDTACYLSLFGGNEQDDGLPDNAVQWWGNVDEAEPSRRQRSETQYLLRSIPATTGNLQRVKDAVERDLAWLREQSVARELVVAISMPALNRVGIAVTIDGFSVEFVENWKNTT